MLHFTCQRVSINYFGTLSKFTTKSRGTFSFLKPLPLHLFWLIFVYLILFAEQIILFVVLINRFAFCPFLTSL